MLSCFICDVYVRKRVFVVFSKYAIELKKDTWMLDMGLEYDLKTVEVIFSFE